MTQIHTEPPKEGQFVTMWKYDDKLWGSTYKVRGDLSILEYQANRDQWQAVSLNFLADPEVTEIFYIY